MQAYPHSFGSLARLSDSMGNAARIAFVEPHQRGLLFVLLGPETLMRADTNVGRFFQRKTAECSRHSAISGEGYYATALLFGFALVFCRLSRLAANSAVTAFCSFSTSTR